MCNTLCTIVCQTLCVEHVFSLSNLYPIIAKCLVPKTSDFYEPSASTKKRNSTGGTNFLSTTRRRTAEIRLGIYYFCCIQIKTLFVGNDGKLSTTQNGYLIDDDYSKRPRSPIDRIKSLFGGGIGSSTKKTTGTAGTSGAYTGSNGVSSRYTPGTSTTGAGSSQFNKRYTGGIFSFNNLN